MVDFDENDKSFNYNENESFDEILHEKDRLISLQERDMQSLKREIVDLKKQLYYSKRKKK